MHPAMALWLWSKISQKIWQKAVFEGQFPSWQFDAFPPADPPTRDSKIIDINFYRPKSAIDCHLPDCIVDALRRL